MDEVLIDIRARALALSSIEMLLHPGVTGLVPFIPLVEKSIHCLGVLPDAFVGYRINFMRIVFGARNEPGSFSVSKVAFLTESHCYFVEIVCL